MPSWFTQGLWTLFSLPLLLYLASFTTASPSMFLLTWFICILYWNYPLQWVVRDLLCHYISLMAIRLGFSRFDYCFYCLVAHTLFHSQPHALSFPKIPGLFFPSIPLSKFLFPTSRFFIHPKSSQTLLLPIIQFYSPKIPAGTLLFLPSKQLWGFYSHQFVLIFKLWPEISCF